jgi:hypothetical protein
MIPDPHQRELVCRILCGRHAALWRHGPTKRLLDLFPALSAGEQIMLEIALALESPIDSTLRLSELFRLDPRNLERVGSLLLAMAWHETDTWIDTHVQLIEAVCPPDLL